MIKQNFIPVSITKAFEPIWEEYSKLIEEDEQFNTLLKTRVAKDKRVNKNKRIDSMKIRYAISFCLTHIKKGVLEKRLNKLKENAQT